MCEYVNRLFHEVDDEGLSGTESYWISQLESDYNQYGHLSDRQLEVLRDIHSRRSYSYARYNRPYRKRRW